MIWKSSKWPHSKERWKSSRHRLLQTASYWVPNLPPITLHVSLCRLDAVESYQSQPVTPRRHSWFCTRLFTQNVTEVVAWKKFKPPCVRTSVVFVSESWKNPSNCDLLNPPSNTEYQTLHDAWTQWPERHLKRNQSWEKTLLWSALPWKVVMSDQTLQHVLPFCSPSVMPEGAFKGSNQSFQQGS